MSHATLFPDKIIYQLINSHVTYWEKILLGIITRFMQHKFIMTRVSSSISVSGGKVMVGMSAVFLVDGFCRTAVLHGLTD